MMVEKSQPVPDLLAFVAIGSIAALVTILCTVAGNYPGAKPLLSAVITGLGAGTLILFRQLRKAANSLTASKSRARYVATHDTLTQLPNRTLFLERLADAQRTDAGAPSDASLAIFCVGLDRFDEVSEVLGPDATDNLAIEVASRLRTACDEHDTVARLGDDLFGVLRSGQGTDFAGEFAADLIKVLSETYAAAAGQVVVTCSIGASLVPPGLGKPADALRHAKLALSSARKLGGAHWRCFEPAMDLALKSRNALEVELRRAVAKGGLTMVYQPQVNAKGAIVGVEALMRWFREGRAEVSPSQFIPLSETCGLSDAICQFALRQAVLDAQKWPNLKVAINVSAQQIRSGSLIAMLTELLQETGCNPRNFELEITESVLLADESDIYRTLHAVRRLGFGIALDDFGTGYSSLSYLRRFPVDKIKIDRSFVSHLGQQPESSAIIKAIVDLAVALELKVLAEGVETQSQADTLERLGCSLYQGYLFSKPVAAAEIDAMVAKRVKRAA
jgi:diguanylate cyclase (GGDEF)-like protein